MPEAASPRGVPSFLRLIDLGFGHPSGTGQLCDAQARQGQAVAGGRPRFHLHFTPIGVLVEPGRAVVRVAQPAGDQAGFVPQRRHLVNKIQAHRPYNTSATPFVWVATAQSIIDKVARIAMRISRSTRSNRLESQDLSRHGDVETRTWARSDAEDVAALAKTRSSGEYARVKSVAEECDGPLPRAPCYWQGFRRPAVTHRDPVVKDQGNRSAGSGGCPPSLRNNRRAASMSAWSARRVKKVGGLHGGDLLRHCRRPN